MESGFSINENLLVENIKEKSVVFQRVVFYQILICGGAKNIVITKNMLDYCKHSNKKYETSSGRKTKTGKYRKEDTLFKKKIGDLEIKKGKLDDIYSLDLEKIEKKLYGSKEIFKVNVLVFKHLF